MTSISSGNQGVLNTNNGFMSDTGGEAIGDVIKSTEWSTNTLNQQVTVTTA